MTTYKVAGCDGEITQFQFIESIEEVDDDNGSSAVCINAAFPSVNLTVCSVGHGRNL
jgi:hypothetical protein